MNNISGNGHSWVNESYDSKKSENKPVKRQAISYSAELKQLRTIEEKLKTKYDKQPSKNTSDAMTEIQNALRSLELII